MRCARSPGIRRGSGTLRAAFLLAIPAVAVALAGAAAATEARAAAPATDPDAAGAASPAPFAPLDLPSWVILEDEDEAQRLPWILIADDPQCPYCMILHLALVKAREAAEAEISRAAVARIPFPLAYHDQAAHIVEDAFCLEETRANRPWSAASYLHWLMVEPWLSEPGWKEATLEGLEEDGGFFEANYDKHRITSSRRREFLTAHARSESSCEPGGCRQDADCERLCEAAAACRAACPPPPEPTAGAGAAPAEPAARTECLEACAARFVSARHRQLAAAHAACLFATGPESAHAKTAAAYAWCRSHEIPGTPTVFAGHPSIGFRMLGDSDDLAGFMTLLRGALAEARAAMSAAGEPGGGAAPGHGPRP